jgi:glutamate synthase domain-containing protein 2
MREASADDFFIPLPNVGTFRYGRRTIGDRLAIRRDYLRYVQELGDEDESLTIYAALIATHDVLCVESPPGWESIATLPASKMDAALELGALLKEKEEALAKGAEKSSSEEGAGSGGLSELPMEGALLSAADGSALSGNEAGGHDR